MSKRISTQFPISKYLIEAMENYDYPSEERMTNEYIAGPPNTTVFYTARCPLHKARRFAAVTNKRTYLQCWRPELLEKRSQNNRRYKAFARDFSSVLAREAAWMVAPHAQGDPDAWAESHPESVWARVELPLLKANPNITRIMWVDADNFSRQAVYWQRQPAEAANINGVNSVLFFFLDS